MNIVLCVANYNSIERLYGLLRSVYRCNKPEDFKTIIINTGNKFSEEEKRYITNCSYISLIEVESKKRFYSSVMLLKVNNSAPFCNDETIFFNTDDDYSFNEHTFEFAKKVFEENNFVNYLSFLRGPGVELNENELVTLSGQYFYKSSSAMGGAMIIRWKVFYPLAMEFFKETEMTEENPGNAHHFDVPFWHYLKEKTGDCVYTIYPYSLMQHCNLVSNYLDEKGKLGKMNHMHAINYDPRFNPFEFNIK